MDHDTFEDIKLIGVDTGRVGSPRNDGTRGASLYSVPIRLSSTPPREWSDAFPDFWDRPSSYTSMHRPGIGRIEGDCVILDGTTLEEVERYHAATLKLVVAALNTAYRKHAQERAAEDARARAAEAEHRASVAESAKRIRFD